MADKKRELNIKFDDKGKHEVTISKVSIINIDDLIDKVVYDYGVKFDDIKNVNKYELEEYSVKAKCLNIKFYDYNEYSIKDGSDEHIENNIFCICKILFYVLSQMLEKEGITSNEFYMKQLIRKQIQEKV